MGIVSIIIIAFGLSMDSFAVSVANGIVVRNMGIPHTLRMSLFFGGFQALMPALGWFLGVKLNRFISEWDHWVAFAILSFIGCRMIWEAVKSSKDEEKKECSSVDCSRLSTLSLLAVATSIDAFAVGLSFALLNMSIVAPVLIIGGITAVVSFSGYYIGKTVGHFFENKVEIVGGVILIGIGVKILLERLVGG